jgi:hypothetical protein
MLPEVVLFVPLDCVHPIIVEIRSSSDCGLTDGELQTTLAAKHTLFRTGERVSSPYQRGKNRRNHTQHGRNCKLCNSMRSDY